MSLIIVITFGTSDVQFERTAIASSDFILETKKEERFDSNFLKPDPESPVSISLKRNRELNSYLLVSPRKDGKTLLDNFDAFASIISLPLILLW
ncbi:MAG TPA: hypothetical protein DCM62_02905 [Bacteroidales bacterium]|nr:hypothetical protein [Bacteroidales bacterium]